MAETRGTSKAGLAKRGGNDTGQTTNSNPIRDDAFKTHHESLLLVRPATGAEQSWTRPHTFGTLMAAARKLYNVANDTPFEIDIVHGSPRPFPSGGAGSIFDSHTIVPEEWNSVQNLLHDNHGVTFYVVRQFGFLLIGDGRPDCHQLHMANIRSTLITEAIDDNRDQFEQSMDFLFKEHPGETIILRFREKDGAQWETAYKPDMTDEDFYKAILWKIDAMEVLAVPKWHKWGTFRTLYDTIPDDVRPRLRRDSQEIIRPKPTEKALTTDNTILITRAGRGEKRNWPEPRTWQSFMTICRELCHAKDDIGLVIDARAGIANSRGIVVEFRTIVEDMSDANTPKNDKVDEFNDLKKAAEGGFIEVIKRIDRIVLEGNQLGSEPQVITVGNMFPSVNQNLIKDQISYAIEKLFPKLGDQQFLLDSGDGTEQLLFNRTMSKRRFWISLLCLLDDKHYMVYKEGEKPRRVIRSPGPGSGTQLASRKRLTLNDVLDALCKCTFCNESTVPNDIGTKPGYTLYNSVLAHIMNHHLDRWPDGPHCQVQDCHALLSTMSYDQREAHRNMHERAIRQPQNDRQSDQRTTNQGPKSIMKVIKFVGPIGVSAEVPQESTVLQRDSARHVRETYRAQRAEDRRKRRMADPRQGGDPGSKRPRLDNNDTNPSHSDLDLESDDWMARLEASVRHWLQKQPATRRRPSSSNRILLHETEPPVQWPQASEQQHPTNPEEGQTEREREARADRYRIFKNWAAAKVQREDAQHATEEIMREAEGLPGSQDTRRASVSYPSVWADSRVAAHIYPDYDTRYGRPPALIKMKREGREYFWHNMIFNDAGVMVQDEDGRPAEHAENWQIMLERRRRRERERERAVEEGEVDEDIVVVD